MKKFLILLSMLLITSPVFAKTYVFEYYADVLVKIGNMDVIYANDTGWIKAITNAPPEEAKKKINFYYYD